MLTNPIYITTLQIYYNSAYRTLMIFSNIDIYMTSLIAFAPYLLGYNLINKLKTTSI